MLSTPDAGWNHGDDMNATLQGLNQDFIAAVRNADVRWFDENLSADFRNRNSAGEWETRERFLEINATPFRLVDFRCEDVEIRLVHPDVALIHAKTRYSHPDGAPGAGRYVDVWVRSNGQWRCASADVMRSGAVTR
jgi:ketosteroid isomerase-like protein